MYTQFFQLRQAPFSIAPDPRYLFMSERHREALAHLLYGVQSGGGFVLLTGEIGAGKTTVCRCLLEQIPENCHVAYIFNPKLSVIELLQSICEEFGIAAASQGMPIASAKGYVDALNAYLLQCHAAGQNNVLIIDEAQNLAGDVLEQLRLLTNLETSERKLLQIVLIGQPELRDMLARPELEQLAQRVIARYHLGPLSLQETAHYIQHRLATAGATLPSPFPAALMPQIHRLTKGVPRRINLLCDRALLGAYAASRKEVTPEILAGAGREVFGAPQRLAPVLAPSLRRHWRLAAGGIASVTVITLAAWAITQHMSASSFLPQTAHSQEQSFKLARSLSPDGAPVWSRALHAPERLPRASEKLAELGTLGMPAAETAANLSGILGNSTRDARGAYRLLGQLWGIALKKGDACQVAGTRNVQCYRGTGGIAELRRLDRPAILTLRDAAGATHYALLVELTQTGAVLRFAGNSRPVEIGLLALAAYFPGEFTTFWRAPPGYRPFISPGERGQDVDWLGAQLARLSGSTEFIQGQPYGAAMARQVREFQAAQGLVADGVAGPLTMMVLNGAVGVNEPRLQSGMADLTAAQR